MLQDNPGVGSSVRVKPKTQVPTKVTTESGTVRSLPHVVSLFCGAGGLDWGFKKANFPVAVAFDKSSAAIKSHKHNFPDTKSIRADLRELTSQGMIDHVLGVLDAGSCIGVIGGPPCQGFSRANAGSTTADPRNSLVQLYLDTIKALQTKFKVEFVVFENVLGIKDKKHLPTFQSLLDGLKALGFDAVDAEYCALDFGVPQNRRRIIVTAMARGRGYPPIKVRKRTGPRNVEDVIRKLCAPAFFSRKLQTEDIPGHANHWTMRPKSARFSQLPSAWRATRSFRLTKWDAPSPTIAFGHREIHVHPSCTRRLSIYEAMLLQGFPKVFILKGTLSDQVEQISNAVPPPLALAIAQGIRRAVLGVQP